MTLKLNEVLGIEGIVIRKIPLVTISLWASSKQIDENTKFNNTPNIKEEVIYCNKRLKYLIKETKENSLGGKYIVTMENGQDELVRFTKKRSGIGDSIEQAYLDYISKNTLGES